MVKAYIYPNSNRSSEKRTNNPYIDNFTKSLEGKIDFLNKNSPTKKGIWDVFRYIKKIDILFLNWIENVPDNRYGLLQSFSFLAVLYMKRLIGIKVVWTLHNKISHYSSHYIIKRLIFKSLLKKSDLILTHTIDGVEFSEAIRPGVSKNIYYFPHPIVPFAENKANGSKKYDILIWGAIAPYKGIDMFLRYLYETRGHKKFRILIAGRVSSTEYYNELLQYQNDCITIRNQFICSVELAQLISQSKIILFTYVSNTVLSSGALIDSIAHKAIVLGPKMGAFEEMGNLGIINTYKDFNELLEILPGLLSAEIQFNADNALQDFIKNCSWHEFGKSFYKQLSRLDI